MNNRSCVIEHPTFQICRPCIKKSQAALVDSKPRPTCRTRSQSEPWRNSLSRADSNYSSMVDTDDLPAASPRARAGRPWRGTAAPRGGRCPSPSGAGDQKARRRAKTSSKDEQQSQAQPSTRSIKAKDSPAQPSTAKHSRAQSLVAQRQSKPSHRQAKPSKATIRSEVKKNTPQMYHIEKKERKLQWENCKACTGTVR